MDNKPVVLSIVNWIFGAVIFAIGFVNTFWGNDRVFGIFIILLSLVYFLQANDILQRTTGFSIPGMAIVKIILGVFIVWAALGVGELFEKVELMKMDLRQ